MAQEQQAPGQVHGSSHPAFSALHSAFTQAIESGTELGASLYVSIDGVPVLDLHGGFKDPSLTDPWKEDTVAPIWSLSKTISNLAVLLLVDRGVIDLDAPVCRYWPDFAAFDPSLEQILVRHILGHTAGLPSWDRPTSPEELFNLPLGTESLIRQKPWWTPGEKGGYHAISQGYLCDGLVRQVTGRSLPEFVKSELAVPLNADFHLGIAEQEWNRIAEMVPPPPTPGLDLPQSRDEMDAVNAQTSAAPSDAEEPMITRAFRGAFVPVPETASPAFRLSGIPSIGGFSNARAVNRILSVVALGGEVDGKRYISDKTIARIFEEQSYQPDLILGHPIRFGIGFWLPCEEVTGSWIPDNQRICFGGGWGGSMGVVDLEKRMVVTYVMNRMGMGTAGNGRTEEYVRLAFEGFDSYKNGH